MSADPEARFLELAARHESLRRECQLCGGSGQVQRKGYILIGGNDYHWEDCDACHGLTWLPLPEPERMGALVRLVNALVVLTPEPRRESGRWRCNIGRDAWYHLPAAVTGLTPEAALTEALLANGGSSSDAQ